MNLRKFASFALFVQLADESWAKTTNGPSADNQDRQLQPSHQRQRQRQAVANGDDVSDPTRYPYFARLDFDGVQGCGGALVHPEFVLTAAHCFYPDETIDVFLGGVLYVNDTDPDKQASPHGQESAIQVFKHPCYDDFDGTSDIALLKVAPVTWAEPVAFDSKNDTYKAGDPVTVMGFGQMETQDYADVLQEVELFVTSDEQCDTENKRTGGIHEPSMICALDAANNQDACGNDSGGPLIVRGSGPSEDIIIGVVNTGDGSVPCGQPIASGVYTEASYFADWIQYTICQNAENPPPAEDCNITDPTINQECINLSSDGMRTIPVTALKASAILSSLALLFL